MFNKQKIIIGISILFFGFVILFSFLGKGGFLKKLNDHHSFKEQQKTDRLNKSLLFFTNFIIIGGIIIFLFFWIHKWIMLEKIMLEKDNLEKYLNHRCFFACDEKGEIKIMFGYTYNPLLISATVYSYDIDQKSKVQRDLIKKTVMSQPFLLQPMYSYLKNAVEQLRFFLIPMVKFFQQIDGHLLRAFYNYQKDHKKNEEDHILTDIAQNFEKTINQKKYVVDSQCATELLIKTTNLINQKELTDQEKQYLTKKDYLSFFKAVMKTEQEVYYKTGADLQYLIFEHYFLLYFLVRSCYKQLTNFFSQNKEYAVKYKANIDNCLQQINDFLEIKDIKQS